MASLNLSAIYFLVVDDMTFTRNLVTRLLSELGAKQILEAENGKEALGILSDATGQALLVISDINMPVMHGLEFLKAVRAGEGEIDRGTPFAMLTGHSDKHLVEMALALDVNAFLIKPVSKKSLGDRIGKILQYDTTGQWLKPATDYEAIDVKSALHNIADANVLTANQPLFQTACSGAKKNMKDRQCPIKDIPAEAVLARDVHTSNGRFLMAAGDDLTPRAISMLNDLCDLGYLDNAVWIAA